MDPFENSFETPKEDETQFMVEALYPYQAQGPQELALHQGTLYKVTYSESRGLWHQTVLGGRKCWFPALYTRRLDEDHAGKGRRARGSANERLIEVPGGLVSVRQKTDELFLQWMSSLEAKVLVENAVSDPYFVTLPSRKAKASCPILSDPWSKGKGMIEEQSEQSHLKMKIEDPVVLDMDSLGSLFEGNTTPDPERLLKFCKLPVYMNSLFMRSLTGHIGSTHISEGDFQNFCHQFMHNKSCAERFFHVLCSPEKTEISTSDISILVKDIVNYHPFLKFMSDKRDLQEAYYRVVRAIIFYNVGYRFRDKITLSDMKREKTFSHSLSLLMDIPDITYAPKYFNYSSFYIIHRKFRELDRNKDGYLSFDELLSYNSCSLNSKVGNFIYYLCRFPKDTEDQEHPRNSPKKLRRRPRGIELRKVLETQFDLDDFAWFIMTEEDKSTRRAISIWFLCLDHDGDGYVSSGDMFYYYQYQITLMKSNFMDVIPFERIYSEVIDLINPADIDHLSLSEFQRCRKNAPYIFNIFFNLTKFIQFHHQKQEEDDNNISEWEKFVFKEHTNALKEQWAIQF